MTCYFRVHDLRRGSVGAQLADAGSYLRSLHRRVHNVMHAETRVYTCRSWREIAGATVPCELQWNDEDLPGETFLGSCSLVTAGADLVERIEAEFAKGDAVRLFIFNSDADLCFEEVLAPVIAP